MQELTDVQKRILDFESGAHWNYQGAREDEIRRRFDISPTRYEQILNALLADPEGQHAALAYSPMTVKRLLRLREARAARQALRGRDVTARS